MTPEEELRISDAAELQKILTRYVDSYDGYREASKAVESPELAAAFLEISDRRKVVVEHVATLIVRQGEKADEDGSPEAAVHRWWIRLRSKVTDEDLKATLEECVRGEKELARTIDDALQNGNLEAHHASIVREVATELREALHTFETVLKH